MKPPVCVSCGRPLSSSAEPRHVVAVHRPTGERRMLVLCGKCASVPGAAWRLSWVPAESALAQLRREPDDDQPWGAAT